MASRLTQQVRRRAGNRCEYCQLPQSAAETPFQLDHIIAEQHGGPTVLQNPAWCCFYCNKYKGPNIAGLDPETGQLTRLFQPRQDIWNEHFQWEEAMVVGRTAIGRTTIGVLNMNRPLIVLRRAALIAEGIFPQRGS